MLVTFLKHMPPFNKHKHTIWCWKFKTDKLHPWGVSPTAGELLVL